MRNGISQNRNSVTTIAAGKAMPTREMAVFISVFPPCGKKKGGPNPPFIIPD
jgi:hypothetical protein